MSSTIAISNAASSFSAGYGVYAAKKAEAAAPASSERVGGSVPQEFGGFMDACVDSYNVDASAGGSESVESPKYLSGDGCCVIDIEKLDEYMELLGIHLEMLEQKRTGKFSRLSGSFANMSEQQRESVLAKALSESGVLAH